MQTRRTLLALAAGALLAAAATADPAGVPLAPAGACAEPRGELQTSPDQAAAPDDEFEIDGGPLLHFTPTQVAATGGENEPPPSPPGFTRGPCDAPNASCGLNEVRKGRLEEGPATPDPLPGGNPTAPGTGQ
jgi:hypothetical protein